MLTLDEAWKSCLEMWNWIAERIEAGDKRFALDLKEEWLKEHGDPILQCGCFFCQYQYEHSPSFGCPTCPGVMIDPSFDCGNSDYHYAQKPLAFTKKLRALRAIYEQRKAEEEQMNAGKKSK